ncbi:MAG TPA: hypothetical protein PK605_02840 [Ignavibacteria bacterium]|nr:hypothetical protein [Ignavibacteria bacterium]HRF65648.1 hypothetical protein [Ignavibacteria bacterium]HRJ03320.1 hypothetical protein [Ignavibacteria bacterium]
MKESKLIGILKTFSQEEFRSFEKMVYSPFFTIRDVTGLFEIIKGYHPEFNSDKLEKQIIFKQLFKGEAFNEKKLKNMVSELTRLAEEFLVNISAVSGKNESIRLLAGQYKERKNDKLFIRTLNILENKLHENLFDSIECYNEEEKLERLKESYYNSVNNFERSVTSKLIYSEYFTISFLIRFMRQLRDKNTITIAFNLPFENTLLDSVYESLDFDRLLCKLKEDNYPMLWLIEIYYYVYKSSTEIESDFYYNCLKSNFLENIEKFSHKEKYFLFNDLIDCCVRKCNIGLKHYEKEEFEIYTYLFDHNAYSSSENDYLAIIFYRNVMLLALNLREFEWLRQFILNHSDKLKPEYRENMMNLASANLSFEEGKFEKALKFISKVQYDFFLYKTDVKKLMLMIYYELNLFDQAFSLIDSFKHFLTDTTEISALYKTQHSNFVNIYNKLIKAKSSESLIDAGLLVNEIEKFDSIAGRNWLIRKVNEFTKKGLPKKVW